MEVAWVLSKRGDFLLVRNEFRPAFDDVELDGEEDWRISMYFDSFLSNGGFG